MSPQLYQKLSFVTCQNHNGGGERARTDDLLRAKQVLSQLSYTPEDEFRILEFGLLFSLPLPDDLSPIRIPKPEIELVGLSGVEPLTSRLSGVRSNRN